MEKLKTNVKKVLDVSKQKFNEPFCEITKGGAVVLGAAACLGCVIANKLGYKTGAMDALTCWAVWKERT